MTSSHALARTNRTTVIPAMIRKTCSSKFARRASFAEFLASLSPSVTVEVSVSRKRNHAAGRNQDVEYVAHEIGAA